MDTKVCRECGTEKPIANFRVKHKRPNGSIKRGTVCRSCESQIERKKKQDIIKDYPRKIIFSVHADDRSKLRQVDTSRLTRTLLSIKLSEGSRRYGIPNTPLVVVYSDDMKTRIRKIITVIVDTKMRIHKEND